MRTRMLASCCRFECTNDHVIVITYDLREVGRHQNEQTLDFSVK